jgi:hypothetical protein
MDAADQIRSQILKLEDEVTRLQARTSELRGQLRGLRDALSIVLGDVLPPHRSVRTPQSAESRVPNPSRSPGWAAALQYMERSHPTPRNVDEIEAATIEAGHPMARNTLRSVLSNASRAGIVERVSVGRYRIAQKYEPPSVDDADGGSHDLSGDAGSSGELPRQDLPNGSTPLSSTIALVRMAAR